jgi:hypothetical protein
MKRFTGALRRAFFLSPLLFAAVCASAQESRITSVTPLQGDQGLLVRFAGPVVKPSASVLKDPNRVVLDFEGTGLAGGAPKTLPGWGSIYEVRLGLYKGKARVVADFGDATIPRFGMETAAEGLRLKFNPHSERSQEAPLGHAPPSAGAPKEADREGDASRGSPKGPSRRGRPLQAGAAFAGGRPGNGLRNHYIDFQPSAPLPAVVQGLAPDESVVVGGRSVTLVSVQLKLTHREPEHVIPVLKCVCNMDCDEYTRLKGEDAFTGLNVNTLQPRLGRWQGANASAAIGVPTMPYDEARAAALRNEWREERRLQLAEEKARGKPKNEPARRVAMDPRLKALIPYTTLWAFPEYKAIWVKDTVERIEAMRRIIAQVDVPRNQVLIEARVVQATRDWARGLGVVWGGRNNQQTSPVTATNRSVWGFTGTGDPGARTPSADGGPVGMGDIPSNFVMNQAVNGAFTGIALQFGQIMGQYATDLDVRLNIGERINKAKVVSRPKVQVLSGRPANMKTGLTVAYPTTSSLWGTQMQLVPVDLLLSVRPAVQPDGRVHLTIAVTDNSLGPPVNGFASIQTRASNTELIVNDGETCVIGGIAVHDRSNLRDGWPGLMNLPVVNLFFSTNSRSDRANELLVFITPTIVKRPPAAR